MSFEYLPCAKIQSYKMCKIKSNLLASVDHVLYVTEVTTRVKCPSNDLMFWQRTNHFMNYSLSATIVGK